MTKYPVQIDSEDNIPVLQDTFTLVSAAPYNNIRSAIIAVEQELGIKPSATYGTVRSRLDSIDTIIANFISNPIIVAPPGDVGDVVGLDGNGGFESLGQGAQVPDGVVNDIVGLDGLGGLKNVGPLTHTGDVVDDVGGGSNDGNQKVVGILGFPITGTLQDGYVLQYNDNTWEPALAGSGGSTTGTPGAIAIYDLTTGALSENTGLKVGSDTGANTSVFSVPYPIKPFGDTTPMVWASKVVDVTAGSSAYIPTTGQFGFGRLIVVQPDSTFAKPYIWLGFNTLDALALVTVFSAGNSGSVIFKHASDASGGATVAAGETVWLAFNGTRIVKVGSDTVDLSTDPPPSAGDIETFDPASLELSAYWGPGYTGSPHPGTASAGTSGLHSASAGSNVPSVGTLNGLPIMVCDGVNDHLDPSGNLGDYFGATSDESFTVMALFKCDSLPVAVGTAISDQAIISEAAGTWSISVTNEGFTGFIQTISGAKIVASPPPSAGVWHVGVITYDNSTIKAGLDGPPSISVSAPPPTNLEATFRTPKLFRNFNDTAYFNGSVARIIVAPSVLDDETIDGIIAFWNAQFALSI